MYVSIGDYHLNNHNAYGPPCLVPSPSLEKAFDFRRHPRKSTNGASSEAKTCAVHIHGYHIDGLWEIIEQLKDRASNFDLLITTDCLEKKEAISEHLSKACWNSSALNWKVIQTENRGRNIGPLLIDLFDQIAGYECVLHMHTKKSEHWDSRSLAWTEDLHKKLIGSAELISDARRAFHTDQELGLLIPQPSEVIRTWVHWGQNFSMAKMILQEINHDLNLHIDAPLVFPVGMMFWFRPNALAKLSEACRKLQPLPLEPLPLDGSPLHAIERLVAHSCEASGYRWQLICDEKPNDEKKNQHKPLSVLNPLTETYIQASSMLGVEIRRLKADIAKAEQGHKLTAARLQDEERKHKQTATRLEDEERKHKQTAERLNETERLGISLEEDYAQTLKTLDQVRNESYQNWLITMEIVNSRIWHSTKFIRRIKDGFRQKQALGNGVNGSPQAISHVADTSSQSIQPTKTTTETDQTSCVEWLKEHLEQDWKLNQDLIRQSNKSNHNGYKDGTKVIIIDWKCPEIDKDSGSVRMDAIIRIMLELGVNISFVSQAINQERSYISRLQELGVSTYLGIDLATKHLSEEGQSYEYAYMARPKTAEAFIPFVQLYCPNAKLIYDTVDLHYIRMRRAKELDSEDSNTKHSSAMESSECYYARELIISKASDKVVVVSDEEMRLLGDEDAMLDIVTIPNIHTISELTPGFGERKGLLFIGGFDHQPNKDAMIYFCSEILPQITKILDDIKVTIVGSNMPDEISKLQSEHIRPLGYVEDLKPVLEEARIFVAPLRYGAGMKGKVGLSMSHGLPVVGTSIAAEGFGFSDGKEMLITDSPSQFAEYTINLYRNEMLWNELSKHSKNFIKDNYSPSATKNRIASLLNANTYSRKVRDHAQ
jgi:glycosyltransferase involved in cell wall biosynthesis